MAIELTEVRSHQRGGGGLVQTVVLMTPEEFHAALKKNVDCRPAGG